MKRALLSAWILAGGLLGGCTTYSQPPPLGNLTIYWSFLRHTSTGNVAYDTTPSPGGTSACAQSGVENVVVTYPDGTLIDPNMPSIPCVWSGSQGATFPAFEPGSYTIVVTGYQTDSSVTPAQQVATYTTTVTLDVHGGVDNQYDVQVEAVQQPIDVAAYLFDPVSQGDYASCAAAGVDTVTYTLVDFNGTAIAQSPSSGFTCGQPTVVFTGPLDLDAGYTIRVQGFDTTAVPAVLVADSCSVAFDHFGAQIGPGHVQVDLNKPIPATCR